MSSMYKLTPLVPVDLDVKPVEIMYHIPSYHAAAPNTAKAAVPNGLPEETYDPVKDIETKQHALIKSLMNLGATMDSFLKEIGKSGSAFISFRAHWCIYPNQPQA
ncbi:unnamed protein product [Nippostrongylus brasiliensis]|uniref:Mediator of RNA polymerase II transcription subunit 7 n=1 Tax=Nippostrongylus brasiliensis TaxID=27835 RepID=A0A0N4XMF2_NIPBR|nr:unnamed protein product [Nippostrongylus brasiliensis]